MVMMVGLVARTIVQSGQRLTHLAQALLKGNVANIHLEASALTALSQFLSRRLGVVGESR